ncbi:MAG: hypothetical protein RLZZ563_461 [Pseudomonadota bacterium]
MAGRILIVDDVATNRIVLKVRLSAALYDPILAADGAEALQLARSARPDLMLLDLQLPDIGGLQVLERLRADPVTRDLPVIVHSSSNRTETRMAALRAGADDVLHKPADDQLLLARIRSLLRRHDPERAVPTPFDGLQDGATPFTFPGLIALMAPRPQSAHSLRRSLGPALGHRIQTLSREEALADHSPGHRPDAYLIDATGEDPAPALRLLPELRAAADSRHAGIVVLADHPVTAALALDLGADDALVAALGPDELSLRLDALIRRVRADASRRASVRDNVRLAMTDPLTGLHNRRYGLLKLAELAEPGPVAQDFAVLLVDIDHFKSVNDRFGHPAGDAVLIEVARRLGSALRPGDLLARIGGEEFLIALPGLGLPAARHLAERICAGVHASPIRLPGSDSVTVTVSIGLAFGAPGADAAQINALIDCADRGLLAAKSQGRNRVTLGLSAA